MSRKVGYFFFFYQNCAKITDKYLQSYKRFKDGVYGSTVVLKLICLTLTGIIVDTTARYPMAILSKVNSDELHDKNRQRAELRDRMF